MAPEAHHQKTQREANTCTPYSFFTLHATWASMDQYRQTNCAQHSALNTTRECLVYRSCSLLTVLVFLACLHAKIHCAPAFGWASLSTPFQTTALLSASCMTGKLPCLLALTFLLAKVLQIRGPLPKTSVWKYWLNSWVDYLQGVQEGQSHSCNFNGRRAQLFLCAVLETFCIQAMLLFCPPMLFRSDATTCHHSASIWDPLGLWFPERI